MNESYQFILNSSNEINETNQNVEYLGIEGDMLEDQIAPIAAIIFTIAGTIENCLVCLAILLDRKLQSLTHYFLFSLAVNDLLFSLFMFPGRLLTVRFRFQPSTFPLCFLYLVADDFLTAASAAHICLISLERYIAIRNPFNQRNFTKKKVAAKIGLVWAIAFLTVIPYTTFIIISQHPDQPKFCSELFTYFTGIDEIVLIECLISVISAILELLSFIMTTVLLHGITKKLKSKTSDGLVRHVGGKKNSNASNNNQVVQILQSEMKALIVVWLISFTTIICVVPYEYLSLYYYLIFTDEIIPSALLEVTAYLNYLIPVLHPIVYTLFSKTYRDAFKNIILFNHKYFK